MSESDKAMQDYRDTCSQQFRGNQDVIKGWRWFAMLNYDTCIACILQHGIMHSSDEIMECHDGCRCVAMPVTKTFAELGAEGVEETDTSFETGRDWFIRQKRDIQRRILGTKNFTSWRNGAVTLEELAEQCCPGGMVKTLPQNEKRPQIEETPENLCPSCGYQNIAGAKVCGLCSEVLIAPEHSVVFADRGQVGHGLLDLVAPMPKQRRMTGNCPQCGHFTEVKTGSEEGQYYCPTCKALIHFKGTLVTAK